MTGRLWNCQPELLWLEEMDWGGHTEAPRNLVGLARDKQVHTVVLAAQLEVEAVLKLVQSCVLAARNGDGGGLVASRVGLYLVLEGVVVEVVLEGC